MRERERERERERTLRGKSPFRVAFFSDRKISELTYRESAHASSNPPRDKCEREPRRVRAPVAWRPCRHAVHLQSKEARRWPRFQGTQLRNGRLFAIRIGRACG